jgi:hypothetical protein
MRTVQGIVKTIEADTGDTVKVEAMTWGYYRQPQTNVNSALATIHHESHTMLNLSIIRWRSKERKAVGRHGQTPSPTAKSRPARHGEGI